MSSRLIREIIDQAAVDFKDITAVQWLVKKQIHEISYPELVADVTTLRHGLIAEGFTQSHIALVGLTSLDWVEACLGVFTGRCASVPLEVGLPREDLMDLINRSDAEGLFLDAKFQPLLPLLLHGCPALKKIWIMNGAPDGSVIDSRVESIQTLREIGAQSPDVADPMPEREDLALMIFTSGTTGKSKGVMLSQHNLAENVDAMSYHTRSGVVMMNVLPIHHAFCLVMDWLRGFAYGATIAINDSLLHLIRNMATFRPHSILMVPMMIETIYKRLTKADPSIPKDVLAKQVFGGRLHFIFTGGAHLDPYYIEKLAEFGITVLEGYGMSECSPVISSNMPGAFKPGSVGKPIKNVELAFSPEGEILVKGSSVMKKYYKMPSETSAALQDGWLHTGDKGYLDEDGFLFLNGRLKNLIILSNGENVSPEEIENKLALNELVGEVVITGGENGLTARIFPDAEACEGLSEEEVREGLQACLDAFNRDQPGYRQITGLVVRKNPFHKTAARKIKRQDVEIDEP